MSSKQNSNDTTPVQQQLLSEIRESVEKLRETKITHTREDARTAMEHNLHAATFYEKLCLVNGATLALSLTLLGSALQYGPGHHLPRISFVLLVVPGWVLLLLSTHFCALRIVGSHNINRKLMEHSAAETNEFYYSVLKDITQRMSTFNLEELKERLRERLVEIDKHLEKQNELKASKTREAEDHSRKTDWLSRLAFSFTILAISFLCIFAVKILLAL